jgi:hypothetical protein
MTVVGYMLWFVGMAIATVTILTVGVLSAAEIIRWQRPRRRSRPPSLASPGPADSAIKAAERSGLLASTRSGPSTDGSQGSNAA